MRSRSASRADLEEMARRRLERLSAEIAGTRSDRQPSPPEGPTPGDRPVREPVPQASPRGGGRHVLRTGRRQLPTSWLRDRLPPALTGGVRWGGAQFAVLATILSLGLAGSAWWVLRTDDSGSLVPVSHPASSRPASLVPVAPITGSPSARATARGSGALIVDVSGKVRRPGIATLPPGSRVVDALAAAGGVRRGVDLSTLNQARPLVDGEQILVGQSLPAGASASAASSPATGGAMVSLNTADQATLETLPGVGPVTALSILEWRAENGGFRAVDDLLEVSGIGDAILTLLPIDCQA